MMNIEEILPELFGEKRVYYCQRCLNHGLREKRKNHKLQCIYKLCQCSNCIMVERRRQLNSRLMQIDGTPTGVVQKSSSSSEEDHIETASPSEATTESGGEERDDGKPKERRPNCQRCAQHNVSNRLKGHKRTCPFRECFCQKCQVVVERQKLMADQIKLRRRQKRAKISMSSEQEPTVPELSPQPAPVAADYVVPEETMRYICGLLQSFDSSNNALANLFCEKCTQQAMNFHNVMKILDPQNVNTPLMTLTTILSACPHRNE